MLDSTAKRRVSICASAAALNSVSLGMTIGCVSTAAPLIKSAFGLSAIEISLFQGSISFWAMQGAAMASLTLDPLGRRASFVIASILFIGGALVQALARNYATLMVGGGVVGMACGFGLAVDPIYIAEVSPAAIRGMLVSFAEIAICTGQLLGFAAGLLMTALFGNELSWRGIVACEALSPIALIVAVALILPESPRWLALRGREDDARQVFESFGISKPDANALLGDIVRDLAERDEQTSGWYAVACSPSPVVQFMAMVGVGTAVAQMLSGVDPVVYQFIFALGDVGLGGSAAYGLLVGLGVVKLATAVLAASILDKVGRRPLLVGSALSSCAILAVLALVFGLARGGFIVCFFYVYIFAFEIGLGPGCWLIPSELFYNKIRFPAMGLATFSNRFVATVLVATAAPVQAAFGWHVFYAWVTLTSFLGFAFLYTYLPETKGRTLEQMYDYVKSIVARDDVGPKNFGRKPAPPLQAPLRENASAVL